MRAVPVEEQSGVAEARRIAQAQAAQLGLDDAAQGRAALVATELATNLLKHAGRGTLLVGDGTPIEPRPGGPAEPPPMVSLLALDAGPGMADPQACLRDGHSTAGTAGQGLGAVLRQSAEVQVWSRPGQGVALLAGIGPRLLPGGPTPDLTPPERWPDWGAISVAMPGQEVCGDAWAARRRGAMLQLMVADGLGHGPEAAQASTAAIRGFLGRAGEADPAACLEDLHPALRPTRGAAVAIARLQPDRCDFAGIGNIAGVVLAEGQARRMVSMNGTLGHMVRRFQAFAYPLPPGARPLVVMHSDGLGLNWNLAAYPGLTQAHPLLVAALLWRDHSRGRDDATVLVARGPR